MVVGSSPGAVPPLVTERPQGASPTRAPSRPGDLERFLQLLWSPGDVREVRIPKWNGRDTASGYFDDTGALVAAVARYEGKANLYVTLNPVNPALLARAENRIKPSADATTSDQYVTERRWLLVDIDPVRPSSVSATDAETAAAHKVAEGVAAYLEAEGWSAPILAMSGNGYALLYPIDLPNDAASTALVAGVLSHLASRFDSGAVKIDTTVSNAARIACLVGTMKVKGDSTADRPHRRSALIRYPAEPTARIGADRLRALMPTPAADTRSSTIRIGSGGVSAGWVRGLLDAAGIEYRVSDPDAAGIVWYGLRDCPFHPGEGPWKCGPGERPDGVGTGKCFHNRGAGKGWADFRDALGLGAPATGQKPPAGTPPVPAEGYVLPFCTARQLAESTPPEVPWRVHGYAADHAITELAAPIKTGKTEWLMRCIAAVLDGRPFLGRATERTPVVYLTEQGGSSFRAALGRAGLLGRDDLHILPWPKVARVPWAALVEGTAAECRRVGAGLLIVDTLSRWAGIPGSGENDAGAADAAMGPLQEAAAAGLCVIVVRHERKGGGEVGEASRGSSAFGGAADILVSLRRAEGNGRKTIRVLRALSRFDETPDELVIELTEDGYVALGDSAAVAYAEARASAVRVLTESEPLTLTELTEATGQKRSTLQSALHALEAEGWLVRVGEGKKGDPHRWTLPGKLSAAPMPEVLAGTFGETAEARGDDPAAGTDASLSAGTPHLDRAEGNVARVECLDYRGHATSGHRRAPGGGFVCVLCTPAAA